MRTIMEILNYINQFEYEESSAMLETILSEHLRGRVYISLVNKHIESCYFDIEYTRLLNESRFHPQKTVEGYIEKWGLDNIVRYLTAREEAES